MQTTNRPRVGEVNGLVNAAEYHAERHKAEVAQVHWDTKGLTITRLRLLSDPGFPAWDVSYCHGVIDGKHVDVILPFSQLPKRGMKSYLYKEAKKTGVFIDGLFSSISTLC